MTSEPFFLYDESLNKINGDQIHELRVLLTRWPQTEVVDSVKAREKCLEPVAGISLNGQKFFNIGAGRKIAFRLRCYLFRVKDSLAHLYGHN